MSAEHDRAILDALEFTPVLTCTVTLHSHSTGTSAARTCDRPAVARLRAKCWRCNAPMPIELICISHYERVIHDHNPLTEHCPSCQFLGAVLVMSLVPIDQPSEETHP